ncbi:MAG: hypothetical protein KAW45_02425 [Thermoplasmatales archaeon]|nr:hypothetical protein [Thermoplasmatales archaeon]
MSEQKGSRESAVRAERITDTWSSCGERAEVWLKLRAALHSVALNIFKREVKRYVAHNEGYLKSKNLKKVTRRYCI